MKKTIYLTASQIHTKWSCSCMYAFSVRCEQRHTHTSMKISIMMMLAVVFLWDRAFCTFLIQQNKEMNKGKKFILIFLSRYNPPFLKIQRTEWKQKRHETWRQQGKKKPRKKQFFISHIFYTKTYLHRKIFFAYKFIFVIINIFCDCPFIQIDNAYNN